MLAKKKKTTVQNILLAALVTTTYACEKHSPLPESYEYKYVGADTGRVITFDTGKREVSNGHRVFGFEFCDKPSFRICFYGEFTLAIPKGELKKGDAWQIAGSKFSVMTVNPSKEEVNYVITNYEDSGEKMYIFFNQTNGIWGLKLEEGEMFKLTDTCGLGCSKGVKRKG